MLNAQDLVNEMQVAFRETESRGVRTRKLPVSAVKRSAAKKPALAPPGSITVYLGRQGSRGLDAVRKALDEGGGDAAQQVFERMRKQLGDRRQVTVREAIEMMVKEPVFAELRYGGATVASHLFVPKGLDVVALVFPYNGGALASEGFVLVEHVREGAGEGLDAVVVRNDPVLTEVEKAALKLVPRDQLVRNVGVSMACDTTGAAVAAVVVAVVLLVVALATAGCAAMTDRHLEPDELKRLGPAASARRILDLRRQALTQMARG